MQLFDSHCHLQDTRISYNLASVIARAKKAGVKRILCCASTENDWHSVLSITNKFDGVIPALGIHPWYVNEQSTGCIMRLKGLLLNDPRVALGEIGLDHAIPQRNDENQLKFFYGQLTLARLLHRSASIHCRKAWGSLMALLRREKGIAENCVIHSFSGPFELIKELVSHGLSISFSGSITYETNRRGREAVTQVPADRLLIETDSPDILPKTVTGVNEPAHLVLIAQSVALLRGVPVEVIGATTFANAERLFCR